MRRPGPSPPSWRSDTTGTDPDHGKVSNWIIGNEINNQQWNHMGATDITNYVQTYQEAFRVFYTAIKSTSANDRVFFSLDYNLAHTRRTAS